MAPKKKEGNSKAKKKGKCEPSPEERERLDLLERASQCSTEAKAEKKLGEQFIAQSEQLKQYWEFEKNTKSEKKQSLLQKEHRLKEIRDRHAIELSKYKQTIKEQLFSNQDDLSRNVTESLVNVQCSTARHHHESGQQEHGLHEISVRIDRTNRSHEDYKTAVLQWRDAITSDFREQATRRIASLASYSEKKFKSTREQCGSQLREELRVLKSTHDDKIRNAMEQNRKQFLLIRKNCNMTINSNLDSITSLRSELNELREQDRFTKKALHKMHNQNESILAPLEDNKLGLQHLNDNLSAYKKQKKELDAQKRLLKLAEEELKEIEWDHEVLFQQFEALQKDHIAQKKNFNHSIYSAQQQSNYENLLLEERIRKLSKSGNKNAGAIMRILQKANIELGAIQESKIPINDIVKEKNDHMQALQQELNSITAARSRLLEKYEVIVSTT